MTNTRLRLAPDLALPLAAITETFGLLAARGAGKRNAAAVMAEEMFRAKLRSGRGPSSSVNSATRSCPRRRRSTRAARQDRRS